MARTKVDAGRFESNVELTLRALEAINAPRDVDAVYPDGEDALRDLGVTEDQLEPIAP